MRSIRYGETSLVVTIFTALFGVQVYLVNGARSQKKSGNKSAMFQPGALLDMAQVGALMQKISADPKDVKSYAALASLYFTAGDYKNSAQFSRWQLWILGANIAGVIVLAFVWRWIDSSQPVDSPSLFSRIEGRFGWPGLLAGVVLLAAMSVVGDLFESLVKRAAGAKDNQAAPAATETINVERSDALDPGPAPVDAERVAQIRKAIEQGDYPVIPMRVADAMIAAGMLLRSGQ